MKQIAALVVAGVLLNAGLAGSLRAAPPAVIEYSGACDASAVVALNDRMFAVADDEDSVLRVYARDRGGAPLHTIDLTRFLGQGTRKGETDLEDAARIGDIVYWISSHGRNSTGKLQTSRHRFFATTASVSNGVFDVRPVGRPYSMLLQDLVRDPRLQRFNLIEASKLPPKNPGALNIEGLCATPEGHLLIGFRNPIPQNRALIVPLLNPAGLTAGQPAQFGDPILLDLGGLGIRSMTAHRGRILIVAGSYAGGGGSRLYEWQGGTNQARWIQNAHLASLNPEAIASFPGTGAAADQLMVLSDDGTVPVDCVECKKLKDPRLKRFRGANLTVRLDADGHFFAPLAAVDFTDGTFKPGMDRSPR